MLRWAGPASLEARRPAATDSDFHWSDGLSIRPSSLYDYQQAAASESHLPDLVLLFVLWDRPHGRAQTPGWLECGRPFAGQVLITAAGLDEKNADDRSSQMSCRSNLAWATLSPRLLRRLAEAAHLNRLRDTT